ncbi:MAG: TlpA family protein disulfide reductase [Cryomorphaceae bacterium]|nr:MAG: TlpA family protein disulfide reductase [Cryomorphaceae bacterium]
MRLSQVALFFAAAYLIGCTPSETPEDILKKSRQVILDQTVFTYDFQYLAKYFDNTDTLNVNGNVVLYRVPSDSTLGYHTRIASTNQQGGLTEHYFNGRECTIVDHEQQSVLIDSPDSNGTGVPGAGFISGNYISGALCRVLTAEDPFNMQNDDVSWNYLGLKEISGEPCHHFEGTDPDQGDYADFVTTYFISASSYLPVQRTFSVRYVPEDTYQYNELTMRFNRTPEEGALNSVAQANYPDHYQVNYYKATDYKEVPLLEVGTKPANFTLPIMLGEGNISLEELRGKIVLLDFWYVSCAPCKKAIPHLQALHRKYAGSDVVVLGVNPVDADRSDQELQKFFGIYGMTYPNVLDSGRTATSQMNVRAYPTLYLLDREGKVYWSHVGFSEEMMAMVDEKVVELLGQASE